MDHQGERPVTATNALGVWTSADCALVLIDFQKEMFQSIRSETRVELVELHVRLLARDREGIQHAYCAVHRGRSGRLQRADRAVDSRRASRSLRDRPDVDER